MEKSQGDKKKKQKKNTTILKEMRGEVEFVCM